jgi:hypothetical protein
MAVSTIQNASLASGVPGYANLPAGSVLQVVNGITSTEVTTTSGSYSDTTLTATITPKFATSTILVLVTQTGIGKDAGNGGSAVMLKLLRASTTLTTFASRAAYTAVSNIMYSTTSSINYLDSPATTSATTYKTQIASNSNGGAIYAQLDGASSTITLMEIAA